MAISCHLGQKKAELPTETQMEKDKAYCGDQTNTDTEIFQRRNWWRYQHNTAPTQTCVGDLLFIMGILMLTWIKYAAITT